MSNECLACNAYEELVELLEEGYGLKDAFHAVLDEVTGYAYEEGQLDVLLTINQFTGKTIERIVNDDECECSCN